MVRILTEKEAGFLRELEALVTKYDAFFMMDSEPGISIIIYETDGIKDGNNDLETAIHFNNSFDECELHEILEKSSAMVKLIATRKYITE